MLPSTLNVAHYLMGASLKQPEQEVYLGKVRISHMAREHLLVTD